MATSKGGIVSTILTGDTHGDFDRIEDFCEEYALTQEDVMVILGDAGIKAKTAKRIMNRCQVWENPLDSDFTWAYHNSRKGKG